MNFRTTLFLLVLVVAVGLVVYFTSSRPEKPKDADSTAEHKLLAVDQADVTHVSVTNSDGKQFALEKKGAEWKVVEPVKAPAKTFEADELVRSLVGLQSRGEVDSSRKAAGGLDHPSFVVELTGKGGKVTKLAFGDKSTVGDSLYVQVDANDKANVVGNDIYAKLDKPVSNYRDTKLVTTSSDQIKQLAITNAGKTIKLEKKGEAWQLTEPSQMPAEASAVSDLLAGVTGLNAAEFVDSPEKPGKYGLNHPRMTVWFSTAAPTATPATTQPVTAGQIPGGETIRFGGYQDILKTNVFASLNGSEVAIVAATAEKTFDKTPLELRNKEVLNIDPEKVSGFTLAIDRPATTQPTTRPADLREFTIERRKVQAPVLGPTLPVGASASTTQPSAAATTQPSVATTQPSVATTQPSVATTQPAVATTQPSVATTQPSAVATTQPSVAALPAPATKQAAPTAPWFFASGGEGDAEEGQVKALLDSFHPLRVDKYIESAATTQPAGTFTLTLHTIAASAGVSGEDYVIRFTDRSGDAHLIGTYKDLSFEVDRGLIDKLTGDFKTKKPAAAATPPPSFPHGAGGAPFGGE
ncbi:MAG TPA: DUF4340 domain-containing protein [Tepidisphaeraceae bacterium]|jgi:hypothetical protein|nr:DUF4340 domain-containing protein [Tepidisphaeraceae bacterium]